MKRKQSNGEKKSNPITYIRRLIQRWRLPLSKKPLSEAFIYSFFVFLTGNLIEVLQYIYLRFFDVSFHLSFFFSFHLSFSIQLEVYWFCKIYLTAILRQTMVLIKSIINIFNHKIMLKCKVKSKLEIKKC